jgi:hypothetical protein
MLTPNDSNHPCRLVINTVPTCIEFVCERTLVGRAKALLNLNTVSLVKRFFNHRAA